MCEAVKYQIAGQNFQCYPYISYVGLQLVFATRKDIAMRITIRPTNNYYINNFSSTICLNTIIVTHNWMAQPKAGLILGKSRGIT